MAGRSPQSCYSDSQSHPPPMDSKPLISSLNAEELAKFTSTAETWWDFKGPFKHLHLMNPSRLSFIRSTLCRHFRKDAYCARPFEGLRIIDVGCGGGILSEPLARMGATVTGIDAGEKNIKIATIHAGLDPLTSSIDYSYTTAEQLVREGRRFDAVIASEVIEHVADPAEFCQSLSALTVPHGATIISTINRSMKSYAAAIVVAEYILNMLPRGTHEWSKFLKPEELVMMLQRASISLLTLSWTFAELSLLEDIPFEVPRGTHGWTKFLTPEELVMMLQRASISVEEPFHGRLVHIR